MDEAVMIFFGIPAEIKLDTTPEISPDGFLIDRKTRAAAEKLGRVHEILMK